MTGIEQQLRSVLHEVSDEPPTGLTVERIAAGVSRRRRARFIGGTAVLCGAAAVASALTVTFTGGATDRQTVTAAPAPDAPRNSVSPTGQEFAAAPPPISYHHQAPMIEHKPPCASQSLTAEGKTVRAADGVLGLVTVTGRECSFDVDPARMRLVDAQGHPLAAKTTASSSVNPAVSYTRPVAAAGGSVRIGFAWTGSFCGGSSGVSLELPSGQTTIRVPLTGPTPPCRRDGSGQLIPGVAAPPSMPVEPAPAAWSALRARLVLLETVHQGSVRLSVILTNSSDKAVNLSAPCPAYSLVMHFEVKSAPDVATEGISEANGGNLCSQPLTVPAKGSVELAIPIAASSTAVPWKAGSTLGVSWAIAGVPTAMATATIR